MKYFQKCPFLTFVTIIGVTFLWVCSSLLLSSGEFKEYGESSYPKLWEEANRDIALIIKSGETESGIESEKDSSSLPIPGTSNLTEESVVSVLDRHYERNWTELTEEGKTSRSPRLIGNDQQSSADPGEEPTPATDEPPDYQANVQYFRRQTNPEGWAKRMDQHKGIQEVLGNPSYKLQQVR